MLQWQKDYVKEHKEERDAASKRYRETHREEHKMSDKAYRAANLQHCREHEKAYYLSHKKAAKDRTMSWKKAHPEKCAEYLIRGRETTKAYSKRYWEANKLKLKALSREYRRTHKQKLLTQHAKYSLKLRGFTSEQYQEVLKKQHYKCAICGASLEKFKKRFHIDHSHATGDFRGLLCVRCNMALGLFKDNTKLLREASSYLKVRKGKSCVDGKWRTTVVHRKTGDKHKLLGVTPAHYQQALLSHDSCCAICKAPQEKLSESLSVDHDHKASTFRGILCGSCNRAIGLLGDNPKTITGAIQYLNR